ncbi:MAG: efflux RND transporter permease subunit [Nitrospirae bacterium]|nr:efflux RND transporter permease subunit [Nitrospirota bacterium]
MINRIIEFSARNRLIVVLLYAVVVAAGVWSLTRTPVDAIPDLSENQVIVLTNWPGRSPQVIEDQITYPLASNLQGVPNVRAVRAWSYFGFSMIYVIFDDDVDIYWARTRVLERLNFAASLLPPGVTPSLGPDGTGVGHVFWYTVEGEGYDLAQLRAIQDWFVRYQLNSVPGVAEVASIGGFVKEYEVSLDPNRLSGYGIGADEVVEAVMKSNMEVGGELIDRNSMAFMVRGLGYIKGIKDLEDTQVGVFGGTPVYVRDVGRVQMTVETRRGLMDKNGEGEAVGGIIVMRYGENAKTVIDAVKEKIKSVEKGLPPGVRIVPAYDRSDLIERAVETLKRALTEESIIVSLVILLFLLHLRSALVVVLTLPIAVLMSFIAMHRLGISSNIMSLGGIAIAIGVLVDSGVIMVENCYRRLSETPQEERAARRLDIIIAASKQVGRPIFFSLAIIVFSFMPVFILTGQAGKLFHPLAYTKTFSMAGSAILAITLVPVLMYAFMRGNMPLEEKNPVSRFFIMLYSPVIRFVLNWKKLTILLNAVALVAAIFMFTRIGSEFMPQLDEGSLLFMPVTLPSISTTEAKRLLTVQDRIIMTVPEVDHVLGKVGRAETATDPAPVSMVETLILLKPKDQWRPGVTKADIQAELFGKLEMPGVTQGWTQPIINRIQMLATGVRTDLGVKVLGDDLDTLSRLGQEAEGILRTVPGAVDLYAERVVGAKYMDITVNRAAAARYGLKVEDVQKVIETAVGGMRLTTTVEGRERFPVNVRYAKDFRTDAEALRRVLVPAGMGRQVPLAQLADIRTTTGPDMVASENSLLKTTVMLNVRGRDMGGFVEEARKVLDEKLKLPPGYYVVWSGQWEQQAEVNKRLRVVVPLVFLIIFVLLYFTFHSALEASMVMLSVPFALVGGVYLVYILGYYWTTAVSVGFIALYGVAVETGVVMVIYLHEALDRKLAAAGPAGITEQDIYDATFEGAVLRLRPKLMTVSVALMGLVPIMWSSGTGADVMKPIAAPLIGGMITSAVHVLIMTPVIFVLMKKRDLRKGVLKKSGMQH